MSTAPEIKLPDWPEVDVDLHTETNNFAPNEFRGVVNPSGLVVYKGSNTSGNSNGDCSGKETKAVKERRCKQWWKYGPGSHDVH